MQVSGAVKARHKGLDATAWFSRTRTISSIERPVVVAIASMAGSISRGRSNKYEPMGVMGPLLRGERRDLLGRPDVIGHPGFHRGRHPKRLVGAGSSTIAPVAMSTISFPSWAKSRGRFGRLAIPGVLHDTAGVRRTGRIQSDAPPSRARGWQRRSSSDGSVRRSATVMHIHSIEAIAVDIPLRKNFGGSTYAVLKRSTVITRMRTEGGL